MFNVFALVDSCFFEIVCLIEARVKFVQEQTLIFKFHHILFFQLAPINDQPNGIFCK